MNSNQHYPPTTTTNITPPNQLQTIQNDAKSSNSSNSKTTNTSFRYKTYNTAFGPLSVNNFLRKDWIKYYILLIILLIAIGIVAIYHHQIVIALHPFVLSMRNLKINGVEVGWLIPVAVLFIISFPPLFGHEIVIILCGLVWGLWLGFAIVCLGTILGELANYWTFKYACSHRAAKLEKKDLNYACMCVVIREGGFWIAFLARLSAIPGHLVTPVFATTGMSLTIFTAATVLSMPKQLAGVYLGTLFTTSEEEKEGQSTGTNVVKYSVLGLTFLVTIVAALYIYKKMALARSSVHLGLPLDLPLHQHPSPTPPSVISTNPHHHHLTDLQEHPSTRAYEHAPSSHLGPRPSSSTFSFLEEHQQERNSTDGSHADLDDPSDPFADDHQHHHHQHSSLVPSPPLSDHHHPWSSSPTPPHSLHLQNPFNDPPYIPVATIPSSSPPPLSIPYSNPHSHNRHF